MPASLDARRAPAKRKASRPAADPTATRQRILDAAEAVFSREGLRGATTREIARAAEVNEVTLFRHFQSRELLLAAVMERGALGTSDALAALPRWETGLRAGVLAYARMKAARLEKHEALCRAYFAEANLLDGATHRSIARIANVTRAHVAAQIRAAQSAGLVRAAVEPRLAADLLTDALIAGALRRTGPLAGSYSGDDLLAGTVDIFVRGIETPRRANPSRKAKS